MTDTLVFNETCIHLRDEKMRVNDARVVLPFLALLSLDLCLEDSRQGLEELKKERRGRSDREGAQENQFPGEIG
jgi:hypothetical protein